MPFEVGAAVAWLTQQFNMSETEATRLIENVGEPSWSTMNSRFEVRCHDQRPGSTPTPPPQEKPARGGITPDEWGMGDGIGVGPRVVGTRCLESESHQWASPAGGGRYALWCPPPEFVWVSVG